MSIATFDDLRAAAGTVTEGRIKLAKSDTAAKDLFLSHSHYDSAQVGPALGLLEDHGARVYVDLADDGLKGGSKLVVAPRVRQAVNACRRLVVLVTEQTASSRWIPWEMGLADGLAGSQQVALFPLRPSQTASELWLGQEYFELYARIERVQLQNQSTVGWAVRDPADGLYWTLATWISSTAIRQG